MIIKIIIGYSIFQGTNSIWMMVLGLMYTKKLWEFVENLIKFKADYFKISDHFKII